MSDPVHWSNSPLSTSLARSDPSWEDPDDHFSERRKWKSREDRKLVEIKLLLFNR